MLTEVQLSTVVAAFFFATLALLVLALVLAGALRVAGRSMPRRLGIAIAFLTGIGLGFTFVVFDDPRELVGVGVLIAALTFVLWRSGAGGFAGWLVSGAAIPWLALWSYYLSVQFTGRPVVDLGDVLRGLAAGFIVMFFGTWMTIVADQRTGAAAPPSWQWKPGVRSIGAVAAAIQAPEGRSPVPGQLVATVAALVAVQLIAGTAMQALGIHPVLQVAGLAVLGAVAATETFVRTMPTRNRLAFEAFSWLAEQEIARFREQSGTDVPMTVPAALRWLEDHPDRPANRWMRADILLMVDRTDEALVAAEGIPTSTPFEAVERLATLGLVRWIRGEDGGVDELLAAREALDPDGDDRLRADVMVAAGEVRRRMADGRTTPGDANQPLVDVRASLGARADGQVGRALRKRLIPGFTALAFVFGLLLLLIGPTPF
ncbi:MAG: hypothetical protein EPO36_01135 [Chloroflexota bacterium]|nr:MAG: hypothetical protein EPO36_01135 [Chloroflexota bacterium]